MELVGITFAACFLVAMGEEKELEAMSGEGSLG